jgi:hypothetical protein
MEEDFEVWSEKGIHAIFERVIDKHLDALMPSLSAPEIPEVKEAYIWAFDAIFCESPSADDYPDALDSAAALEEAVGKVIEKMVAGGPADPNRILRDWRLLKEMGSVIGHINRTARKVVLRKLQVTAEVREDLENTDRRLRELAATIRSDCPYLLDANVELPASTLRLNRPPWTSRLLGECHLDCCFVLGQTRNMSLHLSHDYKAAQRRSEERVPGVPQASPEREH